MKINSITTNTGNLKSRAKERSTGKERECVQNNLKQINNDKINTTIKSNSDGRVSFKGNTPVLHKLATFTSDNPLVAEALFALVVTCALRPLTIMATAKTEEDKEKCAYQAAKSVSTGLVGLCMSVLVGLPIAAGAKLAQKRGAFDIPADMKKNFAGVVKTSSENISECMKQINSKGASLGLLKTISKESKKAIDAQKTLDNFGRTSKNIIDKMFQPIFMPVRATITVALVPTILKALGIQKGGKKKPTQEKQQGQNLPQQPKTTNFGTTNFNIYQGNSGKDIFKSFPGMVKHEN